MTPLDQIVNVFKGLGSNVVSGAGKVAQGVGQDIYNTGRGMQGFHMMTPNVPTLGPQPPKTLQPVPSTPQGSVQEQLAKLAGAKGLPGIPIDTPLNQIPGVTHSKNQKGEMTVQPTPTPSPTPDLGVSTAASPSAIPGLPKSISDKFIDIVNNHILPITRSFGIPDAVAASQVGHESAYTQKPAGNNNYMGLKAKSYPGFAHFDTPEQAAIYYAQTVRALVPNLDQLKDKPLEVLKAMQSHKDPKTGKPSGNYEGNNADPTQYVYDVSHNAAWQTYGGGQALADNPWGKGQYASK